jgi:hypothetical protein
MAYLTYDGAANWYEVDAVVSGQHGIEVVDPVETAPEFWSVYRRPMAPDEEGNHLAQHVMDFSGRLDAKIKALELALEEHTKAVMNDTDYA